jgi:alanine-synthesizing transaminase
MSHSPFAKRTAWNLVSNDLSSILKEMKKQGAPLIDLTESNPTRCHFDYPPDVLAAFQTPANLAYHPDSKGMMKTREAIARYYRQKGENISAEQIVLTSSTSEGYSFIFRLMCNPGEKILFPKPSYPLFQFLVELNDLNIDFYPLTYQQTWDIHIDRLASVLTDDTRGIVLVNPNNPTGSFIKKNELQFLNNLCREKNLFLLSDEVFSDFSFVQKSDAVSCVGNKDILTFTLGGLSKTLAMPQMKLSWIIVNGPQTIVPETLARLEVIADTYLSVNTPVQNALPLWFEKREVLQESIKTRLKHNLTYLKNQVKHTKDVSLLDVEGGWYAVCRLPKFKTEEEWVMDFLTKDYCIVHPGYFFDFEEDHCIVLSLLPEEQIFKEGISRLFERMASSLSSHNSRV